ncbi:MAG: 50S ribosomal protein P1 [Methanobacteriota archaeon]|nr:MAG: 50S ribosomal protein P1 [Euryarchaeota archaeon]
MEYIYSAMVLHSAGKEITEASIKKVLTAAGVKPDDTRIKALTAALEGVDIEEALSTSVVPAAPVAAAPAPEEKEEEEEEKKKKEKEEKKVSEEEAAAGLGALFG